MELEPTLAEFAKQKTAQTDKSGISMIMGPSFGRTEAIPTIEWLQIPELQRNPKLNAASPTTTHLTSYDNTPYLRVGLPCDDMQYLRRKIMTCCDKMS